MNKKLFEGIGYCSKVVKDDINHLDCFVLNSSRFLERYRKRMNEDMVLQRLLSMGYSKERATIAIRRFGIDEMIGFIDQQTRQSNLN